MVYWGKKKTTITSEEELVQRVESLTHDTTEIKHDISIIKSDIDTLKRDEGELGEQVQNIQGTVNELLHTKKLTDLCKTEETPWAKDIQSQIDSNGSAIAELKKVVGGETGTPTRDLVFITTKEITVTLQNQNLSGGAYWYDYEYDISNWDNNEYNLEGLSFKNLHDDNEGHGEIITKTKKLLSTITFDENKMYGTIYTPTMLENKPYQLELTCYWKKVL